MARAILIWGVVGCAIAAPIVLATQSPYLAFRQPIYIAAGFAGILGLGLLLLQPLLAARLLPMSPVQSRQVHRWVGLLLLGEVFLHVGGLWIFSPPDVIDALLLRSPTPFSVWGVLAMWAIFAATALALMRRRLGLPILVWRRAHTTLAAATVVGTVVHALLIEGTMEPISKALLCAFALAATLKALLDLRIWTSSNRAR